jgi:hypothetical protein
MERIKNKTDLRKGMTLYFADTYRYSYTHPVLPATIERITTTPEYIICKMSYMWNYASGPAKVFRPAFFKNKPGMPTLDITQIFFTDKEYATELRDWRVEQWECCTKHGVIIPKCKMSHE